MRLKSNTLGIVLISFIIVIGFILTAPEIIFEVNRMKKNSFNVSWNNLQKYKKLVAITHNNSTGYFIYKGRPMGIHYDMLQEFCKTHGFTLELQVEDNLNYAIRKINKHKADILAIDLTYTLPRTKQINFTNAHAFNRQVLVQRKKSKKNKSPFINAVLELEGKKVFVQKGSVFVSQLKYLKRQTGAQFQIIEDPKNSMEKLIMKVANGEIDYTVCDERVALANNTLFTNIDFHLSISAKQKLCWAVPPREDSLKNAINLWLNDFVHTRKYKYLTKKYFGSHRLKHFQDTGMVSTFGGSLSIYDPIIKKYSKQIHWDWRLLAALIYQESRFNPKTESWVGAQGLMQLMPETAKRMHIENIHDPESNIKAGTRFIQWLDKQLQKEVKDSTERIKFVIASYNVGLGHIQDAIRLAIKEGKNGSVWDQNVDQFIVLKSNKKYYQDPVVKYGYCYGKETFDFVREIMARYQDYKNLIEK